MAGSIKKAAAWLGLVEDDRYNWDESDAEQTEAVHEVDADADFEPSRITALSERRPAERRVETPHPVVDEPRAADLTRIVTVHPRTYNEARTIGEHFRDGVPVIMNLSDMEDADAKRLVDFSAGLIFDLQGTIERVTSKVFLLSPRNVHVAQEDKERIAAGGFFNQS